MKKSLFILLFALVVCFLFIPKFKNTKEEIRIRIVSNSNKEEDILYKQEVVKYFKSDVINKIELTDKYLKNNVNYIEELLNEQFENIDVKYENHTFINKTYNSSVIENIQCKTLLIYIGEHQGPNWWSSVFDGSIKSESTDEVSYQWYVENKLMGE